MRGNGALTADLTRWAIPVAAVALAIAVGGASVLLAVDLDVVSLIGLCAVVLGGGVVLATWQVYRSLLAPPILMTFGWLLPATATFRPDSLDWRLKPLGWAVVLLAYVLFVFGCLTAEAVRVVGASRSRGVPAGGREVVVWTPGYLRRVFGGLFALGMLGFLINVWRVLSAVGWQGYITFGFREIERIFGASTIVNYLFFLNILVVVLAAVHNSLYGRRRWVMAAGAAAFVTLFFQGVRGTVIFTLFLSVYTSAALSLHVRWRTLAAAAAVSVAVFVFVTAGRNAFQVGPQFDLHDQITSIVRYVAPNYKNLEAEVEERTRFHLGRYNLTNPVAVLTYKRVRLIEEDDRILYHPDYVAGTFLRDYFVDFGWFGIILVPYLLGWAVTAVFARVRLRPTLISAVLYGVLATVITFAFWYNELTRIQFWFLLVVAVLLNVLARRQGIRLAR